MITQGRPKKKTVNLDDFKPIWLGVRQKFGTDKRTLPPKKKDYFVEMSQATEVGWSILSDINRKIERETRVISISDKTEVLLRKYLDPSFSPRPDDKNPFSIYFGKYECYYKMDSPPFVRVAELEIGPNYLIFQKEGERYEGKRPEMRAGNLYLTVSSEKRIFHFVCHVGVASRENLGVIPGFLTGINSAALPLFLVILLVRSDIEQKPNVETFFKDYRMTTILRGWDINRISELFNPVFNRISGLFGNWYIYHAEKNGNVRRAKIRIEDEDILEYIGTVHHFEKGNLQIVNNTHISIQLAKSDSTKLLHLLGRIGDASDLSTLKKIKCVFSSTGKGGTVLKAGFCVMVREQETLFPDMSSSILKRDSAEIKKLESEGCLSDNFDIEE